MYSIKNSRGTIIATINEKAVDTSSTSLTLHGRGRSPYGTKRNENIVHLLENFSNSVAPSNQIDGQMWWDSTNRALMVWDSTDGSGAWAEVVPPGVGQGFTINAGAGLSGGGLPTGSPYPGSPEIPWTIINVVAGTGITVNANDIATNDSEINHDNLSGFVANEHIDHSAVKLIAGAGMDETGSPSTIDGNVTFNIVGSTEVDVNANDISLNTSTVMLTTTTQPVWGTKTFRSQIQAQNNASAGAPAYSFWSDGQVGIYYVPTNILSFVTGGTQRFWIKYDGVLKSLNTTYETLVTDADDIPNKKYVDDALATISTPTSNTFLGTSSISGLDGTATYYVNVYGSVPNKGRGSAYLSAINLRKGSTTPGTGTIVDQTPTDWSFDWMNGAAPTSAGFFAEMDGDTTLNCVVNQSDAWSSQQNSIWMTAVQITEIAP